MNEQALIRELKAHHEGTAAHSRRVASLSVLMARGLGLRRFEAERLRIAALLHDVGKLSVHPGVLGKRGRLDDLERAAMQRHPLEGARLAGNLAPELGAWAFAIVQHHERWDGHGYPGRLSGNAISLAARIVAVADAYEAMTVGRPYRRFRSVTAARDEIQLNSGTQFDPAVVRAFAEIPIEVLQRELPPIA